MASDGDEQQQWAERAARMQADRRRGVGCRPVAGAANAAASATTSATPRMEPPPPEPLLISGMSVKVTFFGVGAKSAYLKPTGVGLKRGHLGPTRPCSC